MAFHDLPWHNLAGGAALFADRRCARMHSPPPGLASRRAEDSGCWDHSTVASCPLDIETPQGAGPGCWC